jgi:hypothetical protein
VTSRHTERLMRHAAARAASRTAFVAGALAEYQALHNLDERRLAAWLGIAPGRLARLALCLRPEGTGMRYREGLDQIVAATGVDGDRLAMLLREVEAVEAMRAMPTAGRQGLLIAARDRAEDEPPPDATPEPGPQPAPEEP